MSLQMNSKWTLKTSYELREMTHADLTLVWKWRNHPKVRSVASNAAFIPWEDHVQWFQRNESGQKYIFSESGQTLGVVTINQQGYWSFYLDPELPSGKGYGLVMLSTVLSYLKRRSLQFIKAKVLASNKVSLRLHKQIGFKIRKKTRDVYELFYSPHVI